MNNKSPSTHTKNIPKAATTKNILENTPDILPLHMRIIPHTNPAKTLMPELIVFLTFIRIAENFISLSTFFELSFRFFVVGIRLSLQDDDGARQEFALVG